MLARLVNISQQNVTIFSYISIKNIQTHPQILAFFNPYNFYSWCRTTIRALPSPYNFWQLLHPYNMVRLSADFYTTKYIFCPLTLSPYMFLWILPHTTFFCQFYVQFLGQTPYNNIFCKIPPSPHKKNQFLPSQPIIMWALYIADYFSTDICSMPLI